MSQSGTALLIIAIGLTYALLVAIGRRLLRAVLERTQSLVLDSTTSVDLPPAELAFIAREGDINHTMMVLVVDLIQRCVKSGGKFDGLNFLPYETAILTNVKEFVSRWTTSEVNKIVPVNSLKDPMQWLVRVKAIKFFFGNTLRQFVKDFIKDPLHIRKYFSLTGVMRFTVQLCTSSARQAVEDELRATLLSKGLLVPEERRRIWSSVSLVAAAFAAAGFIICITLLQAATPLVTAISLSLGLANAAVIRSIAAVPRLIPSYDEFAKIADELPRSDQRMLLVRTAVKLARLLFGALMLIIACLALAVEIALEYFILHETIPHSVPVLVASTLVGLSVVQLLLDWHHCATHEVASREAKRLIKQAHSDAGENRPLHGLKKMLSDPNYDREFSNTLAIYGIETLWFLS